MRRTELQHNEKFAMLNKSLEQTDIELNKVNQQHSTLTAEVSRRLKLEHVLILTLNPNPHAHAHPDPNPNPHPHPNPQVAAIETHLQRTLLDAKKMEDAVMANLGEQMAVEKGTANTAKEAESVRLGVQDKEMAQAQLQNELARLKVDALNTVSHNGQLAAQLKATNADEPYPSPKILNLNA